MQFVSARQEQEWNDPKLSSRVKEIVNEAAEYAQQHHNWPFTITSIYRTPAEDAALNGHGVHPAWRAVDVRNKDQSDAANAAVTSYINGRWIYDPARPAFQVCFSEPHGTGKHAHYQVHPNTKRR
jgi:hypothetical protein